MGRESVGKAGKARAPMKAFAFRGTRVTGVVAVVTMTGVGAPHGFRLSRGLLERCGDLPAYRLDPRIRRPAWIGSVSRRKGRSQ